MHRICRISLLQSLRCLQRSILSRYSTVYTSSVEMSVTWPTFKSSKQWLATQPHEKWREFFEKEGYLVVHNLLEEETLQIYRDAYNKMLTGEVDASSHRHDLGSHVEQKNPTEENVCQIMWPSVHVQGLSEGTLHSRAEAVAKHILGTDVAFDFDMLISKAPHTDTCTPWHQDEAYWPDMPDKRAASCWVALDNAVVDNGCMWFVPGSHNKPIRKHQAAAEGAHVLMCDDCSEKEGIPIPIPAGSCTFHAGRTLHYTRGNSTDTTRRAYITNFRPAAMVEFERAKGFDHGKKGITNFEGMREGTKIKQKQAGVTEDI